MNYKSIFGYFKNLFFGGGIKKFDSGVKSLLNLSETLNNQIQSLLTNFPVFLYVSKIQATKTTKDIQTNLKEMQATITLLIKELARQNAKIQKGKGEKDISIITAFLNRLKIKADSLKISWSQLQTNITENKNINQTNWERLNKDMEQMYSGIIRIFVECKNQTNES